MSLADAERELSNLPPTHPLADAVRALLADRDSWRREAERLEAIFASALRAAPAAGRRMAGSGV